MWDMVLCITIVGGFFLLRAVLATVFFYYLLPEGDRCPNCDADHASRPVAEAWNLLMPRFRTSWCYRCGWHGLARAAHLRRRPSSSRSTPSRSLDAERSHSGQLPVSSKKSSK